MNRWLAVGVFAVALAQAGAGAAEVGRGTPGGDTHPTNMTFRLIATRRFMLDNEVTISEFVPGTVARPSLQNAVMPYCAAAPSVKFGGGAATLSAPDGSQAEGVFFVGGFFPGVHFSADFRSISKGAAALLDIAPYDGSILFRVRAEPGKKVEFAESRGGVRSPSRSRTRRLCRRPRSGFPPSSQGRRSSSLSERTATCASSAPSRLTNRPRTTYADATSWGSSSARLARRSLPADRPQSNGRPSR